MYMGIFKNKKQKRYGEVSYWLVENEEGENWYDVRDAPRPKYVVITETEAPFHVCGIDKAGYFGFGAPMKVYFLDNVPDDIDFKKYCYDGNTFTEFVDVEQWRHNEMNWLKNTIDEIEDGGGNADHLRQYRIEVRNFEGNGTTTPFPLRPVEAD